jgi:hypothetical protein
MSLYKMPATLKNRFVRTFPNLFGRNRIHFCAEVVQQKTRQKGEF